MDAWGFNNKFNVHDFIKDVEINKILYDYKHPDYNDESKKQVIWESFSSKHKLGVDQCKSLWKSLSVRYYSALTVAEETNYVPRGLILNIYKLDFLDAHWKDYINDPINMYQIRNVTSYIKWEIEADDDDDDIPRELQVVLRLVKLKRWCDTAVLKNRNSQRLPGYKRMIDGLVELIRRGLKDQQSTNKRNLDRQIG